VAAQDRAAYYRRQNTKQRRAVVSWQGDTKPALFTGQVFAGVRSKTAITGIQARKSNGLGVIQLRVAGVNVGVIATGPGFTALGNVAANALVEASITTGFTGVEYIELIDGRGNPMGRGVINCRN
jgi:hypothetical protein